MALPPELVSCILLELWEIGSSADEHVQTFTNCSLVSKQWSAIINDVNSAHLVIPLSYNGGFLCTVPSIFAIPKLLLCRTITFKVDYMIVPDSLRYSGCGPSITANRGIESVLRRLFHRNNTSPDGIHIYVDYLDDPQVHIPRFWIPLQTTRLTIVYHRRRWVSSRFRSKWPFHCHCDQPIVSRRVRWLCIMGCTVVIVTRLLAPLIEWKCLVSLTTDIEVDIPVPSLTWATYDCPKQDVGPGFLSRVMFGEQGPWSSLIGKSHSCYYWHEGYIPMFEQVIPLGSVGYIDPFSKKFVVLFNAIDPASSTEPRIHRISSILKTRGTKLVTPSAWGVLRKIGAWMKGRSYSIFGSGMQFPGNL
ncbi:hypothetical protein ARMSODRAFT_978095 [Armillaria solidipes]|uniref:Uncharacterized protein n=1 Tax=Armillaria solidipes TaxID=1076256 RepID=A0A2H3B446_9AGAR|nr:hypothetical protein ARMSODRAFT_978095 [Armillaria solidipes]